MKQLLYFAIILFLSSCSVKINNFDQYQKAILHKSQFLPSRQDLKSEIPKIIVFQLNENKIETASQSKLGSSIAKNIENIISQNKLGEIINRSSSQKLSNEITLAQINNNNEYKGPQISDYAIIGAISNASFQSEYSSGQTIKNPKTKTTKIIPAKYTYIAKVEGNIKILQIPSLNTITTIEFSGNASRSENVQQSGGLKIGDFAIGGTHSNAQERDDGLVRQAGKNAISNISSSIKKQFAKSGYILEKRILNNKAIFKINLGSKDGIKKGDKFNIIAKYQIQNPITGDNEIEKRIIASGKVSNIINPKSSWVIINDKKTIKNIRLGDKVQIQYNSWNWGKTILSTLIILIDIASDIAST